MKKVFQKFLFPSSQYNFFLFMVSPVGDTGHYSYFWWKRS